MFDRKIQACIHLLKFMYHKPGNSLVHSKATWPVLVVKASNDFRNLFSACPNTIEEAPNLTRSFLLCGNAGVPNCAAVGSLEARKTQLTDCRIWCMVVEHTRLVGCANEV